MPIQPRLAERQNPVHDVAVSQALPPPSELTAPEAYSPPRLWAKLCRIAKVAGAKTLLTTLTLFYCLQDRDTPRWARGVIIGALGYLVLPLDLIPDIIPGVGYADDWAALVAALATVAAYIKDEHKARANAQLARLFGKRYPTPPEEFLNKPTLKSV
jgi:uncharacterized membrane protein YkvA (DUF1232 family)